MKLVNFPGSEGKPENEKQKELLNVSLMIMAGLSKVRTIFFGGAVRGGKTFGNLIILIILCKKYPGSKWHVVRKSMKRLRETAIPSLQKLVLTCSGGVWRRPAGEIFFEFPNGSKIFFFSEDYAGDKDGDKFKGLETNGFLLEQIEELQKQTYNLCLQRSGSWYVYPMPPAIILATFNPTYCWVKEDVYDAAKAGKLDDRSYFIEAFPTDNPFVTEDQWDAWKQMDEDSYKRYVEGNWELETKDIFLTGWKDSYIQPCEYNPAHTLHISHDFNVDPMTAICFHTDGLTFFHVFREFRIENSDTYELCRMIERDYMIYNPEFKITGDASGGARSASSIGHRSNYEIIRGELGLSNRNMNLLTSNPSISYSRSFCNTAMKNIDFRISPDCEYLIKDCKFVQTDLNTSGEIMAKVRGTNPYTGMPNNKMGHLLDTLRYGLHANLSQLIHTKLHRS